MQLYYNQHFRKLNQALIDIIYQIVEANLLIRSITIHKVFFSFLNIEITLSWINQIIKKRNYIRPQGRPGNDYYIKEEQEYLISTRIILIKNYDKLGIPLMHDLMDHFKLSNLFVNMLSKIKVEINNKRFGCKQQTFADFIKTITTISLDPSVSNFEEAINSDISHCPMSVKRTRDLVKYIEQSNNLAKCNIAFRDYWINFLRLEDIKIIIYYDGHSKPYYSKETHVTGLISNSQKILPGTKYLVVTCTNGYVLELRVIQIDTPYGETVYKTTKQLVIDHPGITKLIIMDREGSGKKLNKKILNDLKVPTLTPLKTNMYKDLNDFGYKKIGPNLYQGKWRDNEKRADDPRWFIIIKYPDRLCVFATNDKYFIAKSIQKIYKTRWPDNEEIIKNLNMLCSFNTNICNGVINILNPKKLRQKKVLEKKIDKANNKIEEYKTRISGDTNNSTEKQLNKQIDNKLKKLDEYENILKDLQNIEKVKIRNTKPDQFVSLLKAGILNLFRYIITVCLGIKNKKAPMEKMMQLIINRKGRIIESKFSKQYIFEQPSTKQNTRLLKQFCNYINNLNINTAEGKKVIASLKPG